jgi:hypothetical protein
VSKLPSGLHNARRNDCRDQVKDQATVGNPFRTSGGYVETLWPTSKIGWIKAAALRPWRNRFVPSSTCAPALMSNDRYGFNFK